MQSKWFISAFVGATMLAPALTAEAKLTLDARYNSGVTNEDGGTTEIVAYNPHTHATYVVNGMTKKIEAISLHYTAKHAFNLQPHVTIDIAETIATFDKTFEYGDLTSITVHPTKDIIAVSVQAKGYTAAGYAVILTGAGELLGAVKVGAQPDNITFTPDGTKLLTANEGEPREGYGPNVIDPQGTISIIDVTNGYTGLTAHTVTFEKFDQADARASLVADEVILKKQTKPSVDLEPEYIAVNADSTKAYVALQENNAIATIDLTASEVVSVKGLGFKDHSVKGNEIDLRKDGKIQIQNEQVHGIYMPDGIATVHINGKDYIVTANEGDGREWGDEAKGTFHLNEIETDEEIVQFDTAGYDGFAENKTYVYGARSFSIFDAETMDLVFDSGSDFETIVAETNPKYFNASNTNNKLDNRSGKKGPEPEDVKVQTIGDETFAYIGLERVGGVMMYNMTNPAEATFVDYVNLRDFSEAMKGDVSPEGMAVITKAEKPQLIVGHEVSGTVTVLNVTESVSPFTDIVNHASKEAIQFVTQAGLFNGVNATTFAPDRSITRSQMALVLHRLAGEPAATGKFVDVASPATATAAAWAVARNIITPASSNVFGATEAITREQFALAVYRYLQTTDKPLAAATPTYTDVAAISAEAKAAIGALQAAGVMIGSADTFKPNDPLTRAHVAIVLDRLMKR